MPSLKELTESIAAKSKFLHEIFEAAGPDIDLMKAATLSGDSAARVEKVRAMNAELADLGKQRDALIDLDGARKQAAGLNEAYNKPATIVLMPGNKEVKSLGAVFKDSPAFKGFQGRDGPQAHLDIELKALFRTAAGWAPESIRLPRVELYPSAPISVIDHIPLLNTTQAAIKYMEETTRTLTAIVEKAQATAVADADIAGEAAFAFTERSQTVEWLPAYLPVTMQQMEDVEGIEDYINQRLTYAIKARLDSRILQGTGVTPLLLGTNSVSGINTQAKGADPTPDAIYKALTLVRATGFAEPSVIFIHPNDWQDIRLLRTADGIYIFGSPIDMGPERIWGVPVVQTTAALENTATLGDYRGYSALFTKRGIDVRVSDSHAYFFTRGTLAVLADMRCAMVHFRPLAFATVTGI